MFQHRHFVALAKQINSAQAKMSVEDFSGYVAEWATMLQGTNPRFARSRFVSACYSTPENARDKFSNMRNGGRLSA